MKITILSALVPLFLASSASADIRLPALVGDHMVLQRDDQVTIWGWADPGEKVSVSGSWYDGLKRAETNELGEWSVQLKTGPAGGPYTLTIGGHNQIQLQDILLGEVWICGGQSNMEWRVAGFPEDLAEVKAAGDQPNLRLFTVRKNISATPVVDCQGNWQVCTPDTAASFSTIGYYFGRELARDLDVPIGLVSCNWGGTVAEAWTSETTLRNWPEFAPGLEEVRAMAKGPAELESERSTALASWWTGLDTRDPGSRDAWQALDYVDASWETMSVPNDWSETALSEFDGIAWMRRSFDAPEQWAGQACTLELGPIDDMDTTWVNGVRVGGMQDAGLWTTDRVYEVPAGVLRAGENVIAVRVFDSGGAGGLFGSEEQISIALNQIDGTLSLAGEWKFASSTSMEELEVFPPAVGLQANHPSVLYNGMLSALTKYAMRGAIWYQGESNVGRGDQYRKLFPAMIADWRRSWGRGDFPFYYVQIAPFRYSNDTGQAAELREAQRLSLSTPNTGMAVLMDLGEPDNIHPGHKSAVAHRLALWARAKTYGRDVSVWSGPAYDSIEVASGSVRVIFEPSTSELRVRGGGALTHFELAGEDGVFHAAQALIDGKTVIVKSAEVPSPLAVRYGWGTADLPNLMNAAGLPASSFSSSSQ